MNTYFEKNNENVISGELTDKKINYYYLEKNNKPYRLALVYDNGARFEYSLAKVNYPDYINNENKKYWLENNFLNSFIEKIMDTSNIDFSKPLDFYVNKKIESDKEFIFNYNKDGLFLLNAVDKNPDLVYSFEDEALKKYLYAEIPSLIAKSKKKEKYLMYNDKNYIYSFQKEKNKIAFIEIKSLKGELLKTYKMDIYKLREKLNIAKKFTDENIISEVKKEGLNIYMQMALETIVQTNYKDNLKYNPNFDKNTLDGFITYHKPTLKETMDFFATKRIIEYEQNKEKNAIRQMSKNERVDFYNKKYNKPKKVEEVNFKCVDKILKESEIEENLNVNNNYNDKNDLQNKRIIKPSEIKKEMPYENKKDKKVEKIINKSKIVDEILTPEKMKYYNKLDNIKNNLKETAEEIQNYQEKIINNENIHVNKFLKDIKKEIFRTLNAEVSEKDDNKEIDILKRKIKEQDELLNLIYKNLPIDIIDKINMEKKINEKTNLEEQNKEL